jgi:hypothetical protein
LTGDTPSETPVVRGSCAARARLVRRSCKGVNVILRFFILALLAVTGACGDDDGDGGNTNVTTGLPRGDELSSLSDEDAVQACLHTAQSFNDVLSDSELERISCVLLAVQAQLQDGTEGGSSAIAECKEFTKDCVAGEIDGEQVEIDIRIVSEDDCSTANANASFSTCDATVGDYEDCAGEVKAGLRRKLTAVSCDGLNDVDKLNELLESEIDVSDAPKCKALRTKCANIDFSG